MAFDSTSHNYAEFSVLAEPTKKTRTIKASIIFGAIAVFLISFYLIVSLAKPFLIIIPVECVLIFFVCFIFWKYTSVEYDCVIASGEMQMSIVYGSRSRKELFEQKISSFETISEKEAINEQQFNKIYRCVRSYDADGIVYATFKDKDGNRCLVYFQPTKKALSVIKFYNMTAYKVTSL